MRRKPPAQKGQPYKVTNLSKLSGLLPADRRKNGQRRKSHARHGTDKPHARRAPSCANSRTRHPCLFLGKSRPATAGGEIGWLINQKLGGVIAFCVHLSHKNRAVGDNGKSGKARSVSHPDAPRPARGGTVPLRASCSRPLLRTVPRRMPPSPREAARGRRPVPPNRRPVATDSRPVSAASAPPTGIPSVLNPCLSPDKALGCAAARVRHRMAPPLSTNIRGCTSGNTLLVFLTAPLEFPT